METKPFAFPRSQQTTIASSILAQELNVYVFAALDQSLSDLGRQSKAALIDMLASENIEYSAERMDLRCIYNRLRLLIGQSGAALIMALVYDKLCRMFGLDPNVVVPLEDPYDRIIKVLPEIKRRRC